MARWKGVIGQALRFQSDAAQATEVAIAVQVLNRMFDLGRPRLRPGRLISNGDGTTTCPFRLAARRQRILHLQKWR